MNLDRREMVGALLLNSECFTPDSVDPDSYSAGAEFLDTVAVTLIEAVEHGRIIPNEKECGDGEHREDVISEIAAGSVPVSTHEMWLAFVDLGAYSEQWDEADEYNYDTMLSRADGRLVLIAENAIRGVLAEHFDRS